MLKLLITLLTVFVRFLLFLFVEAISVLVTSWLIPGMNLVPQGDASTFSVAVSVAFVLAIVNLILRPLILLISLPLGWMVVFLLGFFINAITLMLTSFLFPELEISSWGVAFLAGLIMAFVTMVVDGLLNIDNDNSVYEYLVQRQAKRLGGSVTTSTKRGVVMLEIDGLGYDHLRRAIQAGHMPTLKRMIDEEGYQIAKVDCGLPSTTPACQAGILLGNNQDVPAFRWLDKPSGKMMVGGQAAAEIEPDLSNGQGLLEGGSSISNMFSGDADKSVLTFSKLRSGTSEDMKKRSQDFFLLMRDPYFLTRVLVLFFGDVILEVWQGWNQKRKKVEPRVNRLHNGYPFLRSAVNVFLRDIGAYLTVLDIVRGVPAIYTLFAGYDEVAHHAGPGTEDAYETLEKFDKTISRVLTAIERKAPRPYELIVLSDHGQTSGKTFKQLYGMSILEYVQSLMPQGVQATGSGGGDDGTIGVNAMLNELDVIQENETSGKVSQGVVKQAQRVIRNNLNQQDSMQVVTPANLTLCYGGNLAHLYFDVKTTKVSLEELNSSCPGLVDQLVQHEGIGFVVGYDEDLDPVVFGKNGARNLHTGDIVGEDPLIPYGDADLRAEQLGRLADFKNSGDLIINSAMFPDGTSPALEEMVGHHGGLGGEQTDAFIFHPMDMVVPEICNSQEVMAILKSRVELEGPTPKPAQAKKEIIDPWATQNLLKGLRQVSVWLEAAFGALIFRDRAFQRIANDPLMTGPAFVIALAFEFLISYSLLGRFDLVNALLLFGWWLITTIVLGLTARILRGEGKFDKAFRIGGFTHMAFILLLFSFIPVIREMVIFTAFLLKFFTLWAGMATGYKLKGWRTLILPVAFLIVWIIGYGFLGDAIQGLMNAFTTIFQNLGLQ